MQKRWLMVTLMALLVLLAACGGGDQADVTPTTALTLKPTFTPKPETETTAPTAEPTATEAVVEGQTEEGATGGEAQENEQPTPAPEPTSPPAASTSDFMDVMTSPDYGMQAFMWWRPEVAHRDLGLIRDAGFRWVKQDFAWREIEGAAKGAFDWSRPDRIVEMAHDEFGLKILARVDRQPAWANPNCTGGGEMGPPQNLQDYADFLYAMASRYKGRIAAYSIWNEPNLAREWCNQPPNPAEYVEMLRVAYNAIKSADPNAIVISAGLSPTGGPMPVAMNDVEYLRGMYEAMGGNSEGYFDVLGAHAPGFKAPPEVSPDEVEANPDVYGKGRWFTFRRVEDLRAVMEEYGDTNRRVAILEMGWTTDPRPDSPYHWHAVTPEQQAEYLVRAYQFAKENWRPWIGLMSLIYVCNYDWTPDDEQYYWCITEPAYPETIVRPAYEALKAMPKD
ncbi:hypothetical protein ARMA_0927 [Ardenticatena maritima]|uniref:Uncharacterized protein n=1 Tax=Ardenticatena maritima TaxID=872965 RepID=A0A0M9UC31_9CHLR|nr:cellulase family glycosylhydrolase [Ardenticatena maritima]GAP62504.1 hypothetical protein ARMA_0927 [Ardenticatena maritima]